MKAEKMKKYIGFDSIYAEPHLFHKTLTIDKYYEVLEEDMLFYYFRDDLGNLSHIPKGGMRHLIWIGHPHAELMAIAAKMAKTDIHWYRNFQLWSKLESKWIGFSAELNFCKDNKYRIKPITQEKDFTTKRVYIPYP